MTVMTVLSRRSVEILCRAAVVAALCRGWGPVTAPEVAASVVDAFHVDASPAACADQLRASRPEAHGGRGGVNASVRAPTRER